MKQSNIKSALLLMVTLLTVSFSLFSFNGRYGLDSYSIYLNDKLLLNQHVNQPLNLRVLPLNTAKETDQVRIHYKHCTIKNGAGSNRSLTLQNEKGKILKKWVFADAETPDLHMTIPAKELLKIAKSNANQELSLHYSARELPAGEMLTMLKL